MKQAGAGFDPKSLKVGEHIRQGKRKYTVRHIEAGMVKLTDEGGLSRTIYIEGREDFWNKVRYA